MATATGNQNVEQHFRDIYYYLYSNSNSSRSERILSDLSKLILASIAVSKGISREVYSFIAGRARSIELIEPLSRCFPDSITEGDTFSLEDNSLRHVLELLEKIDLKSSPSHIFGDAFQALMGPRLRGDKGQFFTPRSLVRCLTDILTPSFGSRIIDPACGTGGFLAAVLDKWKRENSRGSVIGIDKDHDLALMAAALSAVYDDGSSVKVHNTNSLDIGGLAKSGVVLGTFDYVVTNPPFGAKIGLTDRAILSEFALGHVWEKGSAGWRQSGAVRASQDPQILFIELCIRLLKQGGRMAIVLPEGTFGNAGVGYVWDFIRSQGEVEGLIDCPRTTFQPGTDTKTNVLIFRREEVASPHSGTWISVAYACGHDKRGRSTRPNGQPVQDDFEAIGRTWEHRHGGDTPWSCASSVQPYYLVPRYYDRRLADDVQGDAAKLRATVTTLGELVKAGLLSIKKGHEVGSEAYGTGEVPFVRTSDLHNFEVSHDPTNCISDDIYERYKRQQGLKAGDILMVVDGRYKIGRCAILNDISAQCVVQSHLRILSLTTLASFSPMALLYALSLPSVQREIRRLVFIQSTLGGLGSRIAEVRLPDPRGSHNWGAPLGKFGNAVEGRARYAAHLRSYGNEVEL